MKRLGVKVTVLLMILIYFGFTVNSTNEGDSPIRTSEIERVSFKIDVLEDDVTLISETIHYNARKRNGVMRQYGYSDTENEKMVIDSVFVDGIKSSLVASADIGDDGVYTFDDEEGNQEIRIYNPDGKAHEFTINYRVRGIVKEYHDAQDFNLQLYNAKGQTTPRALDAEVRFPINISDEDAQVFGHGDVEGQVKVADERTVRVDISHFYDDAFAEVRVVLPGQPIAGVANQFTSQGLDAILAYERTMAEKTDEIVAANKIRQDNTETGLRALMILWLVAAGILLRTLWTFYVEYERDAYPSTINYFREIPKQSPALAALILKGNRKVTQTHFIATIFSLYTKRALNLEKMQNDVSIELVHVNEDVRDLDLSEDEMFVYMWLAQTFYNNRNQTCKGTYKQFFNIGNKKASETRNFGRNFAKFQNIVLQAYDDLGFEEQDRIDEPMPKIFKHVGIVFGLTFLISGIFQSNNVVDTSLGSATFVLGLSFYLGYIVLVRYRNTAYQLSSDKGRIKAHIRGFKKYITDYTFLKNADMSAIHLWQKYFVYGVAFGINKRRLRKMYQKIPRAFRETTACETVYMMHYLCDDYHIVKRSHSAVKSMSRVRSFSGSSWSAGNSSSSSSSSDWSNQSSGSSSSGGGGGFSSGGGRGSGGGGSSSF